jgi:hypothetical protein
MISPERIDTVRSSPFSAQSGYRWKTSLMSFAPTQQLAVTTFRAVWTVRLQQPLTYSGGFYADYKN